MEADDSVRSNIGVVCSLKELDSGQLRLVLDDVAKDGKATSGSWSHRMLFTWKDFEAGDIENLALSEKELAGFGHSILARLVAYRKHPVQG